MAPVLNSRLVHLAVAKERPDFAVLGRSEAAGVDVFEEAGLVDRHQRPKTHRDRRELPIIRHQPGMRVRRKAVAVDLLPELQQPLFRQPAFEKGARINAWRDVALDEDQVAAMFGRWGVPEMRKARVVKQGRRLEARDVSAQLRRGLVRPQHNRHRVPSDDRADAVLNGAVAGVPLLLFQGDCVEVGGVGRVRDWRALAARPVDDALEQVMGPLRSVDLEYAVERLDPFAGLTGSVSCLSSKVTSQQPGSPRRVN